jgi:succinoglycan biosynthesis transport protein ExoP
MTPRLEGALASRGADRLPAPPRAVLDIDELPPRHLRDYLAVLWRYRRLATRCFLGVLALTVVVTLVLPRRYTATARLQVARQSPIQLRLQDNVRRLDEGEQTRNEVDVFLGTQIAALRSRDLAVRVMRQYGLTTKEALAGGGSGRLASLQAVAAELWPRGWRESVPAAVAAAATSGTRDGGAADTIDPRLVERYADYLSVNEVRGTDLIDVSFTTPDPRLSAFLTAAHTDAYLQANEDARRATDNLADRFLDRQLAEASARVDVAQRAVDAFATEHPNVAVNQEQQTVAARIAELSTLLTKAEAGRAALETRYKYLAGGQSAPSYFNERPGVQKLRLALLDVRSQRAALADRLGANHPRMLELGQLERELTRQLRGEVAQDVDAVRARFEAAQLREERLRQRVAELEQSGIQLRGLGARYDRLKDDLEAARKLYASLVSQRNDTAVSSALAASNVRVVERGEVPIWPSRPKVLVNLVLGTLAGLVLALGAAFGRDYFDASMKTSADVEESFGAPALAVIPSFADGGEGHQLPYPRLLRALPFGRRDGEAPAERPPRTGGPEDDLVVIRAPWSACAEAFRSMRTALLFAGGEPEPRVLVVTSAMSGEGKTVASLNLACTLGESGAHVLLVDADLRHPRCHAPLGVANDRGLSSLLRGEHAFEDVVQQLDAPRVAFLPAGPPAPNPAELVGSARMQAFLNGVRERYDFVVVDTPPVLPVTDAVVLARVADGAILTVRGGGTSRLAARRARDRLLHAGARFLGVLVNDVRPEWEETVGGYAYRGTGRPDEPAASGNVA